MLPEPEIRWESCGCPVYFTVPEPLICTSSVCAGLTLTFPEPLMRTSAAWVASSPVWTLPEPLMRTATLSASPETFILPPPEMPSETAPAVNCGNTMSPEPLISRRKSSDRSASALTDPLPEIVTRFTITALTRKRSSASREQQVIPPVLEPQHQAAALDHGLDMRHHRLVGFDHHRLDIALLQDEVTAPLHDHLIEIPHVPSFGYHRHCIISLATWAYGPCNCLIASAELILPAARSSRIAWRCPVARAFSSAGGACCTSYPIARITSSSRLRTVG